MQLHQKIAFLFLTLLCNQVYGASDSSVVSALRMGGKLGIGVLFGFAAHVATEYPIVYAHELGHSLGGVIALSNPLNEVFDIITIRTLLNRNPLSVFTPFGGEADVYRRIRKREGQFAGWLRYQTEAIWKITGGGKIGKPKETVLKENLISLSGPIGGIFAAYAATLASQAMVASLSGDGIRERISDSVFLPITIYGTLAQHIERFIKSGDDSVFSVLGVCAATFALLKSGKIAGEILVGFMPIGFSDDVLSDGESIWKNVGYSSIKLSMPKIIGISVAPTIAAIAYGVYKGMSKE